MTETIDTANLRALAEAATPGPWFTADWSNDFGDDLTTVDAHSTETVREGDIGIWPDRVRHHRIAETELGEKPMEDAAFIAAANPSTIIALLDRLAAAEARNATLTDDAERWRYVAHTLGDYCVVDALDNTIGVLKGAALDAVVVAAMKEKTP